MLPKVKIKKIKPTSTQLAAYKKNKNLRRCEISGTGYHYIVFATDADLDGIHIRSLLCGFIHKYLPEFEGRVGILETPVTAVFKNDKIDRWSYNLDETIKLQKGETTFYFKGLGSWDKGDLQTVLKTDGMNRMISIIDFNDCEVPLDNWLGGNSAPRKERILDNSFSIADV